ncbi:MAG: 3-deoxy-D-manno-octulosonic acid transferase [Desulfobacula sp.]|nr:3-deoxy-D-manno-octulosonic acid transferase [Desulfobacula sp.]
MIFVYKLAIDILFIVSLPFLPLVYLFSKKRRANLLARFGFQKGIPAKKIQEKRIWIHALSVGEVKSSFAFVKAFKKAYPQWRIFFTASTITGFQIAGQQFRDDNHNMIDHLGYFPFDLGAAVRKTASKIVPDAVVLVETDLWPNFLYEMNKKNIPVVLINARLSKKTLKGYLFFKRIGFPFYAWLTHIMVQSQMDCSSFETLGLAKNTLSITGNIKFDQPVTKHDQHALEELKKLFGIKEETKVLIAGSTHEGEEKLLLTIYKALIKKNPTLFMIIAPRNPARSKSLVSDFIFFDVQAQLMSDLDSAGSGKQVVFIDSIGLLSQLYALCDVAFIGGSMVCKGGHNPLEAAVFSKPVIFGSDMSDFLEISKCLIDHGGAKQVMSQEDLEKQFGDILTDTGLQKDMGKKCGEVFFLNSGAVQRIIETMEHFCIVKTTD